MCGSEWSLCSLEAGDETARHGTSSILFGGDNSGSNGSDDCGHDGRDTETSRIGGASDLEMVAATCSPPSTRASFLMALTRPPDQAGGSGGVGGCGGRGVGRGGNCGIPAGITGNMKKFQVGGLIWYGKATEHDWQARQRDGGDVACDGEGIAPRGLRGKRRLSGKRR